MNGAAGSVASTLRAVSWLGLALLALSPVQAQRLGEATGFKVADHYPPPHESQIKSLLEGARGRLLENDRVAITELTLKTFKETGEPELVVQAPECLYDQQAEQASSAGRLHVNTADGKFTIEGEGFLWSQTNSSLVISNAVHTLVQPDLFESADAGAKPGTNSNPGPLEVFADRFEYRADQGMAIYRGNVKVSGTNYLALSGGELRLKLPAAQRRLESITMENQVVVFYQGIYGTGQKAIYTVDTGLVTVTGEPSWRSENREGGGDEITIDRTNKVLRATGHAWLKLPGETLAAMNFIPGTETTTNTPASTNQVLQVFTDQYEFHTNYASFHDHVNVVQVESGRPQGSLDCRLMTAVFGHSNDLQTLTAEQEVVIKQQTVSGEAVQLTGRKAEYAAGQQLLTMIGEPTWEAGAKRGKGNLIQVFGDRKEMVVRGNASMRLPAEEMRLAAGGVSPQTSTNAVTQYADIFCEQYAVRPEQGAFRGGVYITHPQMSWSSEDLTVDFPPRGGQIPRIVAEQAVSFDLRDEKGQVTHGTGDKAVYTFSVAGAVTNSVVRLTGAPAVVQSTNSNGQSRVENQVILVDHAHGNRVSTPGRYVLKVRQTGTNVVRLPSLR